MHTWQAAEYHENSSAQKEAALRLLRFCKFRENDHVLDIGCGDGKITALITDKVKQGHVLGIDISPEMINFAQETFSKDQFSNLAFLVQDAQFINYREEFDVVFSSFALQWPPNKNAVFEGAYKSLKTNGILAMTIPLDISHALETAVNKTSCLSEWHPYFQTFYPSINLTNRNEFKRLLEENSFLITQFTEVLQETTFSSRLALEKYILAWFPYLHPLPNHLKDKYFQQVMDKYFEIEPCFLDGQAVFRFQRLDILAKKS